MPPNNSLPTSHRSAELTPASNPISTIRINQVAPVPAIPKTGTFTLIKVLSTSLNPVDYKLASLPYPLPRLMIGAAPHTPGLDFVGRVWSTNDSRLKGGDIVWGLVPATAREGAAADFVVVKGDGWGGKIPEGWLDMASKTGRELEELGTFGVCGFTAFQALLKGDLGFSQTWNKRGAGRDMGRGGKVFINGGSGGVGSFMVQIAKRGFGCESVVATCSGANADLVRSLGADEVVDYRNTSVVGALKEWSMKNGGQQFDLIIDNVGSSEIYYQCHNFLKPGSEGGKYVMVGAGMSLAATRDIAMMLLLPGFLGGGQRPVGFFGLTRVPQDQWELCGKWMLEGRVKAVIEDENRFDLDDIQKAFQKLHGGRTRGKIVVHVAKEGQ